MAAAQFGVGGDGQLALLPGCLVPVGPVGHGRREHGLAFTVGVVHGPVAGGQDLLPGGRLVVAASGGRLGFCLGPDRGQAGFLRAEADLAELATDPLRRPGGFDGVGIAQVQQGPVWQAADIWAVDGAEGGEGLVPGGPLVGVARYGFGADRLGGMIVAAQFPVRADRTRRSFQRWRKAASTRCRSSAAIRTCR